MSLRFVYIRYASGLVRDRAKLFHLIVVVYLTVWFSNRNLNICFAQLWKGREFKQYPIGKICMMTNLSLTYEGKIDKNFDFLEKKIKMAVVLSFVISIYMLIYGSYSSFRDRWLWMKLKINKHCDILVSCSDKESNCMQAFVTAWELMKLHIYLWNFM